jgi:hypothetical protein
MAFVLRFNPVRTTFSILSGVQKWDLSMLDRITMQLALAGGQPASSTVPHNLKGDE